MSTYDLKEIANKFAKKQPKMVNDLTEKTPILERVRWEAASHGLWNMAETLTDVTGPQFVKANAPLPGANVSTDLKKIDLDVLGCRMEVGQDTADQFGGAAAYFAKKESHIVKKAGEDTERHLYYNNWLAQAIATGNVTDCGATTGGTYSILVMRMEEGINCGLFDPTGFKSGTLLEKHSINNAALYDLRDMPGVLGYGVALKGRFGWQNLSTKTVHAIVNIQAGKLPTSMMIDEAISAVRGESSSTMLMCHPTCRNLALAPFKEDRLEMTVSDKNYSRRISLWDDIPVVTSYNLLQGTESAVTIG